MYITLVHFVSQLIRLTRSLFSQKWLSVTPEIGVVVNADPTGSTPKSRDPAFLLREQSYTTCTQTGLRRRDWRLALKEHVRNEIISMAFVVLRPICPVSSSLSSISATLPP